MSKGHTAKREARKTFKVSGLFFLFGAVLQRVLLIYFATVTVNGISSPPTATVKS